MNNIFFSIENCLNDNPFIENSSIIDYKKIKFDLYNSLENKDEKYNFLFDEYNHFYTVKYLKIIAKYYKLKYKTRKNDIINQIVLFELDEKNKHIVNKRLLLWYYINELNNDSYFSKFISI
jgi:hypothetical protein